jgi:hypothetical protein
MDSRTSKSYDKSISQRDYYRKRDQQNKALYILTGQRYRKNLRQARPDLRSRPICNLLFLVT